MAGNNRLSDEKIGQITPFLNANGITERDPKTEGWYNLMVQNDVGTALITVLQNENIIKYCQKTYGGNRVPAYDRVLHAFTLVRPEEVKVLVIGTSPAIADGKAGGVAFSKPGKRNPRAGVALNAVQKFRKALEEGLGNTRKRLRRMGLDEYSFDLKYWAKENKVLLLNAGLTMTGEREDPDEKEYRGIRENCDLWESFMTNLLNAWWENRIKSNQKLQTADNSVDELADKTEMLSIDEKTGPSKTRCNKVHVLLLRYENPRYPDTPHYSRRVWNLPEEKNADETLVVYENVHHPTFQNDEVPNNFMADAPAFFTAAFPQ